MLVVWYPRYLQNVSRKGLEDKIRTEDLREATHRTQEDEYTLKINDEIKQKKLRIGPLDVAEDVTI